MNKKLISAGVALFSSFLLLTGCGAKDPVAEGEIKPEYPKGAILPVFSDEKENIKSTEIELTDFTFTLPEGYAYGKVDYAGYSTYFVWQDKEGKDYSSELDGDIMLYIYEGLDTNSPHKTLTEAQAITSLNNGYIGSFRNLIAMQNLSMDATITESDDEKYFVSCFTGNSGEYFLTTYSDMCFPKTYYGIYAMEQETITSDRRWYGFVFSNDNEGEIFKESEYTHLLAEIKSSLNVSSFYSTYLPGAYGYSEFKDVSKGRSYLQLVGDETNEDVGLFYNTLLYYVETIGRDYERKNIDVSPSLSADISAGGLEGTENG